MRPRICLLGCFVLLAFLGSPAATATIHYRVSLAQPDQHLIRVTMTVPAVRSDLVVQMPAWNALYQIRDFAQRVQHVRARPESDAQPLPVAKLDKQTWRIAGRGTILVEYAVYWDEPGAFSAQLNSDHAFLNLALVLFYVPHRREEDVRVEFADLPRDWRVAVALDARSPVSFAARDYDALVDAPVEMGTFEEFSFEANQARIRVAVHGSHNRASLQDSLRRIVAYQTQLMRDVPFREFLFLFHFGQGGGVGMEHANSTAIFLGAGSDPASISAHEFFHLWNVKRIRPQSLEPVNYTQENWTRALWFAEGVTSTYGDYTLLRAGLWTPGEFYAHLVAQFRQLASRPAHRWKSVEEASLDAWLEKYPLYNRPDFSISYYNKGYLLGVLLDILISDATDNRASLDDVLRHLNEEYAKRGRFYNDSAGIRAAILDVMRRASPPRAAEFERTLADFFARYVAGTDPLPGAAMLERAGLTLRQSGTNFEIEEMANPSERQRRIRDGLLTGATNQ